MPKIEKKLTRKLTRKEVEMIPRSNHYAVTENGKVVFTGNKNDSQKIRKTLQKINPKVEIKVWLSSNRKIGDIIK